MRNPLRIHKTKNCRKRNNTQKNQKNSGSLVFNLTNRKKPEVSSYKRKGVGWSERSKQQLMSELRKRDMMKEQRQRRDGGRVNSLLSGEIPQRKGMWGGAPNILQLSSPERVGWERLNFTQGTVKSEGCDSGRIFPTDNPRVRAKGLGWIWKDKRRGGRVFSSATICTTKTQQGEM